MSFSCANVFQKIHRVINGLRSTPYSPMLISWPRPAFTHNIYSCLSSWTYCWHTLLFLCGLFQSCGREAEINTIFSPRSPPWLTWLFFFVAVQAFNLSSTLVKELSCAPGLGTAECHDPLLRGVGRIFEQLLLLLTCKWHSSVCCLCREEVIL